VFARKPAPVQITWLAYPGTTGLEAMDYRLTDPYLDPPGADADYVEKSIRLPHSFWCYDPLSEEPAVNPLPAASNGWVTFGCLNNFYKVNDALLKLWERVLGAVPASRMVILAKLDDYKRQVLQKLTIDPSRIEFVPYRPRAKYLEAYHRVDIALDTYPCNGHTTSLDALWMGVPVVTLVGPTVLGRGGFSQLTNLGLEKLIAHDREQFVAIASQLARDLPRLDALRSGLRGRMKASPLMDAPRFARDIETVYRDVWRKWCAGH